MFTGLIAHLGSLAQRQSNAQGASLVIEAPELTPTLKLGDSVAVNGVCQTVTRIEGSTFEVQAVWVTLEKTSLGQVALGKKINLERPLRMGDSLDGHIALGHVKGVASLSRRQDLGDNHLLWFKLPSALFARCVNEGPISLDGIALTVAYLEEAQEEVGVSIIPYTWAHTNLSELALGDVVNVETDFFFDYVEKIVSPYKRAEEQSHGQKK